MRIHRVLPLTILCVTMLPTPRQASAMKADVGTLAPVLIEVTPNRAAPHEIVTVTGIGLGSHRVLNVYLMDAVCQYRVEIVEQTDRLLRFRVSGKTPPGRKRVALELTSSSQEVIGAQLVQQDFYVDVDPVQLRDAPPMKPVFPTGFNKVPLYQPAGIAATPYGP